MNLEELKEIVTRAKAEHQIVFLPNAFQNTPSWNTFYNIFKMALGSNDLEMPDFRTLTVANSEEYSDDFNHIVSSLERVHPGMRLGAFSRIHFATIHNNDVPEAADAFYKHFVKINPDKLLSRDDPSEFQPMIHTDPVSNFYLQCEGQTIWRAFYKDRTDSYIVNPGDMIYVPTGVNHSVESMTIRAAVITSFLEE